jgi:hypothetical protein
LAGEYRVAPLSLPKNRHSVSPAGRVAAGWPDRMVDAAEANPIATTTTASTLFPTTDIPTPVRGLFYASFARPTSRHPREV